jgi:hypothetical protein
MRVMVLVKASKESEAGQMPSEKLLIDMGNCNEQLVNAESCWRAKASSRARRELWQGVHARAAGAGGAPPRQDRTAP